VKGFSAADCQEGENDVYSTPEKSTHTRHCISMLKFPTLLEFLDTKIGLIFKFSHYIHAGNKTPEMVLARSLSCSDHPISKCWTYLFLPTCAQSNKQSSPSGSGVHFETQQSYLRPAQMHLHDPKIKCYLLLGVAGFGAMGRGRSRNL
jgi:hypothetical protein